MREIDGAAKFGRGSTRILPVRCKQKQGERKNTGDDETAGPHTSHRRLDEGFREKARQNPVKLTLVTRMHSSAGMFYILDKRKVYEFCGPNQNVIPTEDAPKRCASEWRDLQFNYPISQLLITNHSIINPNTASARAANAARRSA